MGTENYAAKSRSGAFFSANALDSPYNNKGIQQLFINFVILKLLVTAGSEVAEGCWGETILLEIVTKVTGRPLIVDYVTAAARKGGGKLDQ